MIMLKVRSRKGIRLGVFVIVGRCIVQAQ